MNVLHGVRRKSNVAALLGHGSRDRLANPPRGVRGELEPARVVESLDRSHQTDVATLNRVGQRHRRSRESFGNTHHQTQVGGDELLTGSLPRLDGSAQAPPFGKGDLIAPRVDFGTCSQSFINESSQPALTFGIEERDLADLVHVHPHRILIASVTQAHS